ncbi:MAG: glucokinase [Firmicutes bacterium HGW-Firmicutes-1]|jgi:glucokinase|nr:MAG: glucokinase [Firmicutes bacterium HGW-Firmicutes-1]
MYSIGVDLGGTNIAAAIVSKDGKIIKKASVPTLNERNDEAIVKDMALLCLKIVEEANISKDEIHSIGIGSPGIVDSLKGEIVYANNLNFKNSPIAKIFQKYFDKPVYLENDANAAAYGEYISGAGSVYKDLVAITLGTGVGGGIILDGKIIAGSYNAGAELGHIVISIDGELCTCGRHGCWETYSSATGLIREAKKAAKNNPQSLLNKLVGNDLVTMNAKIPFDAAQAGDIVAQEVIDQYIKYLAVGLVNVINMIQPEIIVLGGGVSAQRDNLLKPLKERIVSEIYGGAEALKTEIKVAELGNDAGIIGASMLYKLHV